MARTRCYNNGVLESEDFPLDQVSEHLDTGGLVWVDLCRPEKEDLDLVARELGLHELAVEDALHERQRPKLDTYATHAFLSTYAVDLNIESGELATSEIAIFVTKHALITVRKNENFDLEPVVSRWDNSPDLLKHGVSALLYGLLDHIVDGHFDTVQRLDEQIENLEDLLFDQRPHDEAVQRRSFQLRKSLVQLRRVVLPMREVVNALMRRDLHIVNDEMTPYFQDVYDHVLRATEWTESLRDLVTTIVETNLTMQGNRLNVITKKVTSWAAIIAVPTAITGFYGQNLPYPGYQDTAGFITSSVLIVGGSAGLYFLFKRKDWL
jgi:magnesium transporter